MKTRTLFNILLCLVLSSFAAAAQDKVKSADAAPTAVAATQTGAEGAMLVQAVAAINSGEFTKAQAILETLTKSDRQNDAAYYYLGQCMLKQNNLDKAKECFKKASEADPQNYWYKYWLANTYYVSGDREMTIASYEDLLKEFPKRNDIYFNLVNLYLMQNDLDKAMTCLEQIETIFGKNETVTNTKYDILLHQNKPQEAFKELEQYNEEFSSSSVLAKMGDFSMAEYKDSAALDYYNEALSLDETYVPAILGKAEVYRSRRAYSEYFNTISLFISSEAAPVQSKVQYLSMLISRSEPRFLENFRPQLDSTISSLIGYSPKDTSVLSLAGSYYYSTGRAAEAKEYFRKNKELNPENIYARGTYIQFLWQKQDFGEMLAECTSAVHDFPEELDFVEMQNIAYYNTKNYNGIIDNCRMILSRFPDDTARTVSALSTMGDMYHETGNEKAAFKAYDMALKINPEHLPVLNNYAYYLAIMGKKLKDACRMSRKTIEKEPDNPTYLDTYGWILHLLGKDSEAKTYFKHAMIYGGKESATTLEHYSIVLQALGETDLANVYKSLAEKQKAEGRE